MEVTYRVMAVNPDGGPGRIEFRADDSTLTPYAGLAIPGELVRGLRLVELVDAELAAVDRVTPVKQRRRGLSPGGLVVAISECQLAGAECFDESCATRRCRFVWGPRPHRRAVAAAR